VVGGTIPDQDVAALTGLGVRAVYGVGTPIEDVVAGVLALDGAALDGAALEGGPK
jgi:methylmalonyl-CoA mutase cobalamin-binding domain/chain